MQDPSDNDAILISGARTHNLKDVSVRIPLNALTVITGVSGSGKSTLAFDTLYAEGQRRYVASLSAYARQFLERVDRPDVTEICGICPALSIRQRSYSRNPRSTVGTVTEINDYLRLLFARIGTTVCCGCGRIVERDTPDRVAEVIMALPTGLRLYLCIPMDLAAIHEQSPAPVRRRRRPMGEGSRQVLQAEQTEERLRLILPGLLQQGFARLLIRDRLVDLSEAEAVWRENPTPLLHVVADRLTVSEDMRARLVDSLELCSREAGGRMEVLLLSDRPEELQQHMRKRLPQIRWLEHPAGLMLKFSERFECPLCHIAYEVPEPRLFSFNNPYGACPECQGFGNTITLDLSLVVPDVNRSLAEGAIHPWTRPRYRSYQARLQQFAQRAGIDAQAPWSQLTDAQRSLIIEGEGDFPGVRGFFKRLEEKKYKMHVRIFISRYRGYTRCPSCQGERLRREARNILVGGRRISQVLSMTVSEALAFVRSLQLSPQQATLSQKVLDEVRYRLELLQRVGLDYLTLDRLSSSLSGGESQRIQLAAALGSTLVGTLYVLDEPSIGLHPRDTARLIQILQTLKSLGNTVVVVEHDAEIMANSDCVIDLGPGAGEAGGQVVYQGDLSGLLESRESLTAKYLSGELKIATPLFRRRNNGRYLEILNAHKHNLKHLNLRIPLGLMTCITGVSGSGKSTLVNDVLYHAIRRAKGNPVDSGAGYDGLKGADRIRDAVLVDQSPIGKTPRSNPVTYIKAFDLVRELFAETRDAYARNLKAAHFSFNLPGGRCETCQGNGVVTVEMQFLADVELTCEDCGGRRYKNSVLEVTYRGKNIAQVLDLTVREAIQFFASTPRLIRKLRVLEDVGLGYLRLGQPANSLSGGEAQRIKLASFISATTAGRVLYIFDEPTTGLHFDDIRRLLGAFDKLMNGGNTVLIVEHNLDVIKSADWVIDLGPEGGERGGAVIFEGTPDQLLTAAGSYTGRYLKSHLENAASRRAGRRLARLPETARVP